MAKSERGRVFGFEIQHIFPNQILTENSREAKNARALLASISFNLESRGNKIGITVTLAITPNPN